MTFFAEMEDGELVELLFTEEDRLPRDAVDEFVRRAPSMAPALAAIVTERDNWLADRPEWWAVVHGVYILGALRRPEAALPLARALRLSVAFDCDWVYEELPSIFGALGPCALPYVRAIAEDVTSDWHTRSVALEAAAASAMADPAQLEKVFELCASILSDGDADLYLRQTAGHILLDFRCVGYENELMAFAEEEAGRLREDDEYAFAFLPAEVDDELARPEPDLYIYTRDWLEFYDAEKLAERRARWRVEEQRRNAPAAAVPDFMADDLDEPVREGPAGRNAPCPCGSGLRYRECCSGKKTIH